VLSNKADVRGLYLGSLNGDRGHRLAATDASGIVAGARLLYVKGGDLVSQPFDAATGSADGSPTPLVPHVPVAFDWRSIVGAADDGTLVFLPADEETELVWLNQHGQPVGRVNVPPGRYRSPALSPDGQLLAFQRYRDGLSEIQVVDAATGRARPSLAHSADVQFPVWGAGHRLIYASSDTGRQELYVKDFDRDDPPSRIPFTDRSGADEDKMPTDASRDERFLLVVQRSIDRLYNLWVLPLSPPEAAVALRPSEGTQFGGRLSPDGRSAVYVRRVRPVRDGAPPDRELWACDFPSGEHPRLIAAGGIDPAWPSNSTLSYLDRTGRLTLVRISASGAPLEEIASFPTGIVTPEGSRNSYAWTVDGSKVLVNRPASPPDRRRVMMMFTATATTGAHLETAMVSPTKEAR
jgi:Tol biopolymer transport system component